MKLGSHSCNSSNLAKPGQHICVYVHKLFVYCPTPDIPSRKKLHHLKTFLWHSVTHLKVFATVAWPYPLAAEFVQSKVEE